MKHSPKRLIASFVYEHFELVDIYNFGMVRFSAHCVFLPNGRLTSTISKSIIRGKWFKCTIGML